MITTEASYEHLPHRIKEIFRECASRQGVRPIQLIGTGKRCGSVFRARQDVSKRLRNMGKSYPEIARFMGVDHASVIYQIHGKKVPPSEPIQGPWFVPDLSGEWAI